MELKNWDVFGQEHPREFGEKTLFRRRKDFIPRLLPERSIPRPPSSPTELRVVLSPVLMALG